MDSASKGRMKACTEDRISGLPDEILCHILSFLGTDVAVKTSILSHRWKNVWTKVPTITLRDSNYRESFDRDRFVGFVDRVLLSRASTDIHKFHLHCSELEYYSRFDAWISTAVERNVVELKLSVPCYLCEESDWEGQLYELPRSLYMCKTLVVLRLTLISVITITPTSDCFPSLKVLHLTVCHPDTDSMEKLISCCPVLEDLIIVGSLEEFSYLEFNISTLKLKSLLIFLEPFFSDYKYNIFVNINAPDLEKFEIQDEVLATYSLNNSKSLSKAKIDFGALHMFEDLDYDDDVLDSTVCVHKLFAELLKVKDLSLSAQFLGDPHLMRQYHLPTFANLIRLELFFHRRCSWRLLTKLLKKSPHLKHLVFQISRTVIAYYEDDFVLHVPHVWCPPMWVPICLSSCLGTICIRGFKGRPDEMEVVKYLLKHGEVLNNVIIYTRDFAIEDEMELCQEISMFPRASETCQIEFPK